MLLNATKIISVSTLVRRALAEVCTAPSTSSYYCYSIVTDWVLQWPG